MYNSIFHSLYHRHGDCRVIVTHIALQTKMKQSLFHLWQICNIRLYNK